MCAINEGCEFGSTKIEVYLKEFELKPQHQGSYWFFRNLNIDMVDENFVCKTYEEKDSFTFIVLRKIYVDSNISNNIFILLYLISYYILYLIISYILYYNTYYYIFIIIFNIFWWNTYDNLFNSTLYCFSPKNFSELVLRILRQKHKFLV